VGPFALVLCAAVLAADPPAPADPPPDATEAAEGEVAGEPQGGAGVSPIEIVPRVELRQSFQRLEGGASLHDTVAEVDIQFLKRVLIRYQLPHRLLDTPAGQVSGFGDVQLGGLGIITSDARRLVAIVAGAVLNTASQPALGTGKTQLFFGGGGAYKPRRWLLGYGVVQEQFSVAGDNARPDVNQLAADLGAIVFGRQYNWLKLDLVPTVDFPGGATGRGFGTLEAGSLLIGRVGLFVRGGTQLFGSRQLDYSIAAGIRYLFKLETGKLR
jgi:hypothetical protein